MAKYKLLVIDDEVSIREKPYREVLEKFGKFDVDFVWTSSDLDTKITSANAAGYIVDVRLDNWGLRLEEVIDKIGTKGPVILVSNRWLKQSESDLVSIIRKAVNSPVRHFFAWNEFYDEAGKLVNPDVAHTTVWKIKSELNRFYHRSDLSLRESDTVNILHISDTQFGDPNNDGATFLLDCAIGKFLRREGIDLHFLVVTGDISFSGRPSEYDSALTWFKGFTSELWPNREQEMRERIFIVPGNHDVNLRFLASEQYEYSLHTKELVPISADTCAMRLNNSRYGLTPFSAFAYELTGDIRWLTYENQLCWISDRFLPLGLRFYQINTVAEVNAGDPQKCSIPKVTMDKLAKQSQSYPEKGLPVFNIFVSHHGPPSKDLNGFGNWDEVKNFLDMSNADLLIRGHGHRWEGRTLQEEGSIYDTVDIMAPTTHISGRTRPQDERRGFNLIHLKRERGLVKFIQSKPHEIKGATITPRYTSRSEWNASKRMFN